MRPLACHVPKRQVPQLTSATDFRPIFVPSWPRHASILVGLVTGDGLGGKPPLRALRGSDIISG